MDQVHDMKRIINEYQSLNKDADYQEKNKKESITI